MSRGSPSEGTITPQEPQESRCAAPSNKAFIAAVAACVVIFAIVGYDFLRHGTLAAKGDGRDLFLPYYTLVADFARSGQLLTWNPWSAGGLPDFAEPQMAAASPLTVLFALITGPGPVGWAVYVWAMWLFGGLGVLGLGRHLRSPVWGCFVVAMGWLGSGFYAGQLMHTPHIVSYSFLPWILWRLDAGLTKRSWLSVLQASLLLALSGLGGYPGLTMTTACFCAIWAAGRYVFRDDGNAADPSEAAVPRQRRAAALGARLAVLLLVAGMMLLPSYWGFIYEGKGVTSRTSSVTWSVVQQSRSVQPWALLTMGDRSLARMLPAAVPRDIKRDPPVTWNLYCGIGLLIFAGISIVSHPRSGLRWFILLLAMLALLTALGPALPMRKWVFDYVPLSATFRQSTFFRIYLHLGITVLALLGTRDVAQGMGLIHSRRVCILTFLLASIFIAAHAAVLRYLGNHSIEVASAWLPPALWLLIGPAICLLAYQSRKRAAALVWLVAVCAVVEFVVTYNSGKGVNFALRDSTALQLTQRLEASHNGSVALGTSAVGRAKVYDYNNDQLITKTPVLGSYTAFRSPFMPFVDAPAEQVQEAMDTFAFASGAQRFWFSEAPVSCPADPDVFTAFAQQKPSLPLLIHSRQSMLEIGHDQRGGEYVGPIREAPPMRQLDCDVLEYTPTSMRIKMTAPSSGWVLITDRWARSWKASVDGAETEILGGDLLYRAVKVDPGTHVISMWYRPLWLYCCIALSWGAMLLVAILTCLRLDSHLSRIPSSTLPNSPTSTGLMR